MKLFIVVVICSLLVGIQPAKIDTLEGVDFFELLNDPDAHIKLKTRITTADRIAAHEYPTEHHHVVTEDGYILGLFRIPYSHKLQNQKSKRPVVLLQHGLTSCSDYWVLIGPNDALPFLLADAGYDVWLGNARGNTYSRNHTSMRTDLPHFWSFSWHEIGKYDTAAMIDYALKTNGQGQQAIHYVGHSQGTTGFFVLMSTRPEYNAKIKTAHMLAPVAFMNNLDNWFVRLLAPYLGHYNTYSRFFGNQEFFPYNDFIMTLLYNTCGSESRYKSLCRIETTNNEEIERRSNTTIRSELLSTHPAGVSTDQFLHYLQEIESAHFREFDHGPKKNFKLYGTNTPPDYPLKRISSEIHLWYGDNDNLAAVVDVERLAALLPNRVMHHMKDPKWGHMDFTSNWEVRKLINEPIIAIMKKYEEDNQL